MASMVRMTNLQRGASETSTKYVLTEGHSLQGSKTRVCYNRKSVLSEYIITGICL